MAIVVVQVGQCGNQIGDELFTQLAAVSGIASKAPGGKVAGKGPGSQQRVCSPSPFFTENGTARCVLVDSEPKVVQGVLQRHPGYIREDNVVYGQSGRGNNWGLGYYGVNDPHSKRAEQRSAATQRAFRNLHKGQRTQDDTLLTNALRALHMETRRTNDMSDFEAIILLHSLSGGTGSGMASRLAERIRLYFVEPADGEAEVDETFEDKMRTLDGLDGMLVDKRRARYFVAIPLAPLALGELATQGINAALTLQVLMKQVDAILLLRNDDALNAGDDSSSPTRALLPKCSTFKEVNELMVGVLLPIFHYGMAPGAVEVLVHHCAPRRSPQTGGNVILTLLPTPQRVYERYRGAAQRIRFYALYGGKDFMPGCSPELPAAQLLSPSALQRRSGGESGESSPTGRGRGRGRGRKPLWQSVHRRAPRDPACFGYSDEDENESEQQRSPRQQEDAAFATVNVSVPASLKSYYASLRRGPIVSFLQEVEGVAVLNQARELNRALLLPLLRSAALKVKVGAYMSFFQEVGVTAERITKAYRSVAEDLLNAEEIH